MSLSVEAGILQIEQMYVIVEFEDTSAEIVWSGWVTEGSIEKGSNVTCLFPLKLSCSRLWAMRKINLNTSNAKMYNVKVIAAYNDYDTCRSKLPKACLTSDLDSDLDVKRKRLPNPKYEGSDGDDDFQYPQIPNAPNKRKILKPRKSPRKIANTHTDANESLEISSDPGFLLPSFSIKRCLNTEVRQNIQQILQDTGDSQEQTGQLCDQGQYSQERTGQLGDLFGDQGQQNVAEHIDSDATTQMNTEQLNYRTIIFDSDVAPASQPHCCQEVLKEVVELKFLINNLINLVTPLVQEGSVENSNTTNDMSDRFPLPNLASLLELNETMQAPDVYNSVLSKFKKYRANDCRGSVIKILRESVSKELAVQLAWTGSADKHSLKEHKNFCRALFEASKFTESTCHDMVITVQNWLKNAKKRK